MLHNYSIFMHLWKAVANNQYSLIEQSSSNRA